MSDARTQLQYLTSQARRDLERVIEPDRLQFEIDKTILDLVSKDLGQAVGSVMQNMWHYPDKDPFLKALAQVESRYEIFNIVAQDIIRSRQVMLPKPVVEELDGAL